MEPLVIQKDISAPLSKVFRAWSSADVMRHWFFPGDMTCEATCDFRVGGEFKLLMRDENGEHPHHGEYREIIENKKIAFTWNSDRAQDTLVTISFEGDDTQTRINLVHDLFQNEEQRQDHNLGWGGCLGNLERYTTGTMAVANS